MKNFCLLLFTIVILSNSNAQNNTNSLVGHFYLCSEEGYGEYIFTDTIMRYLDNYNMMGLPYKIINAKELVRLDDDTLEYTILSENKIIIKTKDNSGYFWEETLTRFEDSIPNIYQYSCDMKISSYAYSQILWHQYAGRKIKYGRTCLPNFVNQFTTDSSDIYFSDAGFLDQIADSATKTKHSSKVEILEFETQIINNIEEPKVERRLNKLTYNYNNTRAMFVIEEFYYCYEKYEFAVALLRENKLLFRGHFPTEKMAQCFDKCFLRHHILLEVDGKINFDEIFMNRKFVQID